MYPGDPGAPGSDCSGIVLSSGPALGPGQSSQTTAFPQGLLPGSAVFGLAGGSLGSHVVASCMALAPMPPCLSFEAAATAPTVFITTDAVLRQAAGLEPGETVFLPAAAGGVGLAALQEVASLGGMVVATAGGPPKRAYLRALGINRVANSRDMSFVEDLLLQFGEGVDVVLNTLTSPGLVSSAASMLKRGGRFIEIGKRDIFAAARLAQERPDVTFGYVAVDFLPEPSLHSAMQRLSSRLADGSLRPLPSATHAMSSVVSALRQMSQARHIGKVVASNQQPTNLSPQGNTASLPSVASGGGSVLIVGGTGTLGLLVGAWLADSGIRRISLLGRTGKVQQGVVSTPKGAAVASGGGSSPAAPPPHASAVTLIRCDASSVEDARAAISSGGSVAAPLSAVLHAGGVLADSTFGGQSLGSIRRVFGPKFGACGALMAGGGTLQPCGTHVLFSSVASLLGSPGQANYSAANAALDAAAAGMAAAGLPALSIQWGAWAGGGMAAADAGTAARVERMGMLLIRPERGLASLEGEILQKPRVSYLDWM